MWSAVAVFSLVAAFGASLVVGFWAEALSVSFAAAMLLAPAFVAMMVSIALQAAPEKRVWGQLGAAFAAIYAVMVTITYYLQLAVVRNADAQLSGEILRLLEFTPGSALFAVDMLGYGFMTLATFASAPVFLGTGLNRWLRWWFVAHGLMVVPTLLAPLTMGGGAAGGSDVIGSLVLIGWSVFFLPLAAMVVAYFRRQLRQPLATSESRSRPQPSEGAAV
jgi:hypothetical protein